MTAGRGCPKNEKRTKISRPLRFSKGFDILNHFSFWLVRSVFTKSVNVAQCQGRVFPNLFVDCISCETAQCCLNPIPIRDCSRTAICGRVPTTTERTKVSTNNRWGLRIYGKGGGSFCPYPMPCAGHNAIGSTYVPPCLFLPR